MIPIPWSSTLGISYPLNQDPATTPNHPPDPEVQNYHNDSSDDDNPRSRIPWHEKYPDVPANEGHVPQYCWVEEVDLLIVHVHHYGMDLEDVSDDRCEWFGRGILIDLLVDLGRIGSSGRSKWVDIGSSNSTRFPSYALITSPRSTLQKGTIPPTSTELRIPAMLVPVIQSVMRGLDRPSTRSIKRGSGDFLPDLIMANSVLWDTARWMRIDMKRGVKAGESLSG
jgi:hypothetical protein